MPRPFLETLGALRNGVTLDELAEVTAQVVAAVKQTRKKGSITLKLTIAPPRKGPVNYLITTDEVTAVIPKDDRSETVFFITADNGLTQISQTQGQLPLGAVIDGSTGEIKQVGGTQ